MFCKSNFTIVPICGKTTADWIKKHTTRSLAFLLTAGGGANEGLQKCVEVLISVLEPGRWF